MTNSCRTLKHVQVPVMAGKGSNRILFGLAFFILLTDYSYSETDTLLQGQELKDGGQLVSAFGTFTLGFSRYKHGGSSYYLGIWYSDKNEEEVAWYYPHRWNYPYGWNYPYREIIRHDNKRWVWIANRNRPLDYKYKLLSISADGNLKIFHSGDPIVLTSVQVSGNNTRATLLDNGNFVLSELNEDGSVKQLLWQSFDYPTDTLLPGMKIGINHRTGHNWFLTSGSFTFGMDPNETRQLMIWWGGVLYWRSGVWIDGRFNFSNELSSKFHFQYFSNKFEKYFTYDVDQDGGPLSFPAIWISSDGSLKQSTESLVSCDKMSNERISAGCVPDPSCRKNPPIHYSSYYGGPFEGFRINASDDLNSMDCRMLCLKNCSCVGYTFEEGLNSCQILSKDPFSDLLKPAEKQLPWCPFVAVGGALLISVSCFGIWRYKHPQVTLDQIRNQVVALAAVILMIWRKCKDRGTQVLQSVRKTDPGKEILLNELGLDAMHNHGHGGMNNQQLHFLTFDSIIAATNNFSSAYKLGEGGFGPVYKGQLPDGQEVAIKRLSSNSRQGLVEFKNEVQVIAKLQHNNLVRLVGCCLEKEEKILIYEYMPNKSLDFFLFDPTNRRELKWGRRFNIIEGIAQGLLYLHKYSRLKIIHRDLKASNILLDSEMNPKISDFGMAKIFGSEESKANTNRVVGTYGYMPPEYAIEGIFSTKSDVFSFGVLLLEIVSGKRNNGFRHSDGPLSLIVYAWELWNNGGVLELIDPTIDETHHGEVTRCIHVGLLCVQENPMGRPNMLDVASMLYNEASNLPSPNQPAFYNRRNLQGIEIADYRRENWSLNEVTITEMEGR